MVYIFVGDWRELNTDRNHQNWILTNLAKVTTKGAHVITGFWLTALMEYSLGWFHARLYKNTSHRMHRFCLTCHWFPSNHFLAGFIWKGNINAFKNLHLISWPWYVSYFRRRLGEFTARRPKAHKADSKAVINFNFIYICNFAVHYCHYLIPQTSCSNHIEETQGTGPGVQAHAVCSSTSKYYHWNGMIWM